MKHVLPRFLSPTRFLVCPPAGLPGFFSELCLLLPPPPALVPFESLLLTFAGLFSVPVDDLLDLDFDADAVAAVGLDLSSTLSEDRFLLGLKLRSGVGVGVDDADDEGVDDAGASFLAVASAAALSNALLRSRSLSRNDCSFSSSLMMKSSQR